MEHETLLGRDDAVLVVVDVQERLASAMHGADAAVEGIRRLAQGLRWLDVPILVTEQYPKGLGPTVPALAEALAGAPRFEKLDFSAAAHEPFLDALEETGRNQVVVCGLEAHICVLQTALDLSARGLQVHVPFDAVASRTPENRDRALARLAREQVIVTGVESVLFEALAGAGTEIFKRISALVK